MKRYRDVFGLWGFLIFLTCLLTVDIAAQEGLPELREQPPAPSAKSGNGDAGLGLTAPTDAVIQYDPETDSIIVIADETTNDEIAKVVKTMDQPVPQVLIKVVFIEVTHTDNVDLGVEATFTYDGHGGDNKNSIETD